MRKIWGGTTAHQDLGRAHRPACASRAEGEPNLPQTRAASAGRPGQARKHGILSAAVAASGVIDHLWVAVWCACVWVGGCDAPGKRPKRPLPQEPTRTRTATRAATHAAASRERRPRRVPAEPRLLLLRRRLLLLLLPADLRLHRRGGARETVPSGPVVFDYSMFDLHRKINHDGKICLTHLPSMRRVKRKAGREKPPPGGETEGNTGRIPAPRRHADIHSSAVPLRRLHRSDRAARHRRSLRVDV